MATKTREEKIIDAENRLSLYIAAEQHILRGGQSYSIGNRSLTRSDLRLITQMIIKLNKELVTLRRGNQITCHRVVPRDI